MVRFIKVNKEGQTMAKKFWGEALEVSAAVVGYGMVLLPMAIGKGLLNIITDEGTFLEGCEEAEEQIDSAIEWVGDFGDEHSDAITKGVIGGVINLALGGTVRGVGGKFTNPRIPGDTKRVQQFT